jgi:uroporphyrinogen-III synthase
VTTSPLAGKRVLVTRERPGELGALLDERGAVVVHVPLIAVVDPADGGTALQRELVRLAEYDWLVVTSAAGAERVGTAARTAPRLQLAAVGTTTARLLGELAARPVDVVPDVQQAAQLARRLIEVAGPAAQRFLIAQADRAASVLADELSAAGHRVTACVAYRTVLQRPDPALLAGADALVLASGSSAQSWVDALGTQAPAIVVAIGPTTAAVAQRLGLKITAVAADHSLAGVVTELEGLLAQ